MCCSIRFQLISMCILVIENFVKPEVFLLIGNKNKDSFIVQDNRLSAFLNK